MVSNHTVLSSTVFQSGEDDVSTLASNRMPSPQLDSVCKEGRVWQGGMGVA